MILFLPIYLFCFQVVQEYERAVIFRLGRLLAGGSKGPGNIKFKFDKLLIQICQKLHIQKDQLFEF